LESRAPRGTIGFLAPSVAGTFFRTVLAGVYRVARQRDLRLVVVQARPCEIVGMGLALDRVDGWVSVFDTTGAEQLAATGAPVVTVSRHVPGLPAVLSDNTGGMLAAVRQLTRLGRRRIAFIGSAENSDIPERLAGYRAGLEEAGLPFDERLVFTSPNDNREGGYAAADALLGSDLPFDAIAAATDLNALGVLDRLREAGVSCPEQVAVTGFDDMPEAQAATPPLTTVRLRFEEMGRVAALRLLMHIADPSLPPDSLHVATALVVRRSCGAAPTGLAALPGGEWRPETAGDGASEGRQGWQQTLALRLAETIQHPLPLPPGAEPDEVWPGVGALVGTLAAALDGTDPPEESAVQRAWEEATAVAAYADACGDALNLLDRAAIVLLDALPPERRARQRIDEALGLLRSSLLRVCIGTNARQLLAVEEGFGITERINRALSSSGADAVRRLDWLGQSDATWGCLGLWEGAPGGGLALAGVYQADGAPFARAGARSLPAAFPPLDLAPAEGGDVILLNVVVTPRREWGVLAIGTTYADRISFVDSASTWAGMLGARLDDGALLHELERQQEILREAFERERALAGTVRELGSPLIPLGGGALLVPLIGVIDSARAQQIIDTVLAAASQQRAAYVLLDVSGVPLIDTHVAGLLIRMAQMLQLLGARATLVGVRPEIAQSIVSLGVDLRGLTSHASLENALRELGLRGQAIATPSAA
jgi:DNA-binding LacI/PurR family transcriptional regulator/anti-anti-sigma regulatory factor